MSVAKLAFAGATLVSSSALWQAFGEGTMPVETAATRFAIVLVVSWVALSFVAEMVFSQPVDPAFLAAQDAAAHHLHRDDVEPLDEGHPRPVPPTSMPNP